jgi:hypothetical protein
MTGGDVSIRQIRYVPRLTRRDLVADIIKIRAHDREVEVYISPTGRSIRVYVDGEALR